MQSHSRIYSARHIVTKLVLRGLRPTPYISLLTMLLLPLAVKLLTSNTLRFPGIRLYGDNNVQNDLVAPSSNLFNNRTLPQGLNTLPRGTAL